MCVAPHQTGGEQPHPKQSPHPAACSSTQQTETVTPSVRLLVTSAGAVNLHLYLLLLLHFLESVISSVRGTDLHQLTGLPKPEEFTKLSGSTAAANITARFSPFLFFNLKKSEPKNTE